MSDSVPKDLGALVEAARRAQEHAYAPYSGCAVGAALEAANGQVFTGANVENAAYGTSICAERAALFAAVSQGERSFRRILVLSESFVPFPCGACRQALAEFSPGMEVLVFGPGGLVRRRLPDLLPDAFRIADERPAKRTDDELQEDGPAGLRKGRRAER